ncbi:unnamed protein product [Moneuplotes crassus]|uniref:Uncharacterized protein n=1 Tax=Euplotes crassus TaxID=5936 RepID=A0AAD1XWN6_EUPCR|nr:unnamed protein product [Moneuplotes crassus]
MNRKRNGGLVKKRKRSGDLESSGWGDESVERVCERNQVREEKERMKKVMEDRGNVLKRGDEYPRESCDTMNDQIFDLNNENIINEGIRPTTNKHEFFMGSEFIPEIIESPMEDNTSSCSSSIIDETSLKKRTSVNSDVMSQKFSIYSENKVKFERNQSQRSSHIPKKPLAYRSNKPATKSKPKVAHSISYDLSSSNIQKPGKKIDALKYSLPGIKGNLAKKVLSGKRQNSSTRINKDLSSVNIRGGKIKDNKNRIPDNFKSFDAIHASNRNKPLSGDYSHLLEGPFIKASNLIESFDSQTTEGKQEKEENIHHEYNDSLQASNPNTGTIGENSLPEIDNSVVDEILPFKGLENHNTMISKEGFSGAHKSQFMHKTSENFYSSVAGKSPCPNQICYDEGSYNHFNSLEPDPSAINCYNSIEPDQDKSQRVSQKQLKMYNLLRISKNAQSCRTNLPRNAKFRGKFCRSKNSSSDLKNSIHAEIEKGLPQIFNTGKIISRKMSVRGKISKDHEAGVGNLSYDDRAMSLKGFHNKNNSERSYGDRSLDRTPGKIRYTITNGVSQPGLRIKYSGQNDVATNWKISKNNDFFPLDAENCMDNLNINSKEDGNTPNSIKVAVSSKHANFKINKVTP